MQLLVTDCQEPPITSDLLLRAKNTVERLADFPVGVAQAFDGFEEELAIAVFCLGVFAPPDKRGLRVIA